MANPVIQERKSHIKYLEWELRALKRREKIIRSCGLEHRVPYEFFSFSPEELDNKISSLYSNEGIITMDEYISYSCKSNDIDEPFSRRLHRAVFGV